LIAKGATTGCFYKIFNNKKFKVFDLSTYDFWEVSIPAQKTYEGYYQISHFNLGTAIELTDNYFAGGPIKEKMGSAKDIIKIFKYDNGQSEAVKQGIDIREWEIPYSLLNEANDDILKDMFEAQEGSLQNFWVVMYHKGADEQFYMVRFLSDYDFNTKHFDHGDVSLKLEEVRYESDG